MLNTPAASATGPAVSPEYCHIYCQAKVAEPQRAWLEMVDLSDTEDETYRKQVLVLLARHEKILSGHLGEIKWVSHRIELKPLTRPLRQHP